MSEILKTANLVATIIFALEASFKIIAFGKLYFSNGWNIFDFVIILVSILEIAVEDLYSLAVIRSYRLTG
nr:hypothetical protein BaRGS_017063 [Batillaria attramentaria]